MEEDEDMTPFWVQSTGRRRRNQVSSFFLNSGLLLIFLLIVAFIFVFIIVPSFISFTSQIFRPNLIKKSWDSLNLVLVLFAIVCGFLSRNTSNNNDQNTSYYRDHQSLSNDSNNLQQKSYPSTPHRWYDYQDRTATISSTTTNTLTRLRSFSSYPDLRQESSWFASADDRWRFYDDTHLSNNRFSSYDQLHRRLDDQDQPQPLDHQELKKDEPVQNIKEKEIAVDTFVVKHEEEVQVSRSPPPSPPPPPPPQWPPSPPSSPPPQVVQRRGKRTYRDIRYENRDEFKDIETKDFYFAPPPPPPPPPPPMFWNEKKRAKDFLITLRRRKKKQRQKSVENLEFLFNPPEPAIHSHLPPPSPPPPPPPLPPPPNFFQNLFSSKKGKSKKSHSIPPPPPPPPPPSATAVTRVTKIVSQNVRPPIKTRSISSVEENVESGNASPLIPIPPPPPLPPFKIPAWRFVREGDYVRVGSFGSSRSGSPDLDSVDNDPSDKESSPMAGGSPAVAATPLFCPSPDVNTKADNFIARFRAGLNLEKVNSVKGRSNLGPEASTNKLLQN